MKSKRTCKLFSRKGESFVELLIAVLVVAFGCLIVGVMYSVAFNANLKAKEQDTEYYDALSTMEQMEGTGETFQVTVDGADVTVEKFGNETYSSYRKEGAQ